MNSLLGLCFANLLLPYSVAFHSLLVSPDESLCFNEVWFRNLILSLPLFAWRFIACRMLGSLFAGILAYRKAVLVTLASFVVLVGLLHSLAYSYLTYMPCDTAGKAQLSSQHLSLTFSGLFWWFPNAFRLFVYLLVCLLA